MTKTPNTVQIGDLKGATASALSAGTIRGEMMVREVGIRKLSENDTILLIGRNETIPAGTIIELLEEKQCEKYRMTTIQAVRDLEITGPAVYRIKDRGECVARAIREGGFGMDAGDRVACTIVIAFGLLVLFVFSQFLFLEVGKGWGLFGAIMSVGLGSWGIWSATLVIEKDVHKQLDRCLHQEMSLDTALQHRIDPADLESHAQR